MTTKEDISRWFDEGVRQNATHMLVVCDDYDHEDYPVYIKPGENARERHNEYTSGKHSMQRVMEVYSLTQDKAKQLNEGRAFNY